MNGTTVSVNPATINTARAGVVITASGGGVLGQSIPFTVNPDALDHFAVTNTTDGNSSPTVRPTAAGRDILE